MRIRLLFKEWFEGHSTAVHIICFKEYLCIFLKEIGNDLMEKGAETVVVFSPYIGNFIVLYKRLDFQFPWLRFDNRQSCKKVFCSPCKGAD